MEIVVDHREAPSGMPDRLTACGFKVTMDHLKYCDYRIQDVSIERKSARDFLVSIVDGRLFQQAAWMRKRTSRPVFLLEGNPYKTDVGVSKAAVRGAMLALQVAWYIPIIPSVSMAETCAIFQMLAKQLGRGNDFLVLRYGPRPRKRVDRRLYLLQGLPNIGPVIALRLLRQFKSVRAIFNADAAQLMEVDGIGKSTAVEIESLLI